MYTANGNTNYSMFKFDETITNEDLGVVLAVGGIFQGVGALLGNILTIVY